VPTIDRTEQFRNGYLDDYFEFGLVTKIEEVIEDDDHFYNVHIFNPWSGKPLPRQVDYQDLEEDDPEERWDEEDWCVFERVSDIVDEDDNELDGLITHDNLKTWQLMVSAVQGVMLVRTQETSKNYYYHVMNALGEEKKRRFAAGDLQGLKEMEHIKIDLARPKSWPTFIPQ
jgi:hypothetical protein